jgi:hypothetical protein
VESIGLQQFPLFSLYIVEINSNGSQTSDHIEHENGFFFLNVTYRLVHLQ